jgi:hypothetical protein
MDGLPMFRPTYTSTASQPIWLTVVVIVIVAVHLLFKWNIFLSLYVIGFFLYLQNHFPFPLLIVQS